MACSRAQARSRSTVRHIELAAGDWLRISPAAHRQFRAASDSEITYVCIQVKQGSLDAFTADDAIMF